MENLVFTMEATCDLSPQVVKQNGFKVFEMNYVLGEKDFSTDFEECSLQDFYKKMRTGEKTSTSQINEFLYREKFESLLEENKTIIHIGFSSGMSGSLNNAKKAAQELDPKGEKIFVVDSLVGSTAQGLLAENVFEFSKKAKCAKEVAAYANAMAKKLNAIFTVENLKYLANGGRISKAKARIGNLLQIKPIIKGNDEGKLEGTQKVISRKKALTTLAEMFLKNHTEGKFYVCHADSPQDAQFVADTIKQKCGLEAQIGEIGAVMGSHCGPGTIAVFFFGNEK